MELCKSKKKTAKYLRRLADRVLLGEVVGVTTVESCAKGRVTMNNLIVPKEDLSSVPRLRQQEAP